MLSFSMRRQMLVCAIGLALAGNTLAASFVIKDIRVEGLQRVSAGTIFAYVPIKPGETIDPNNADEVINTLYSSHLFSNVVLKQDGSTLIIDVTELPVISSVSIKGNSALPTEAIKNVFSKAGFTEGQAYNPAMLNDLVDSLYQQYKKINKFQVEITPTVNKLPRGRVSIDFQIKEGRTGRVASIQFVGNKVYSSEQLSKLLDTTTARWNSFFTKSDVIDGEKLDADLKRVTEFYLNRGFLDFKVTSSQVSLADDKTEVILTINVEEGQPYTLTSYEISGNTIVPKAELEQYVDFKTGVPINRGEVQETMNAIKNRLADESYAQAEVTLVPKINSLTHEVGINLVVNPGNRYRVRQIIFTGNAKSYDNVMRRELRQQEAAPYSASDLARSEQRIKRLPQVKEIEKTLRPVDGHPDEVDIVYKIEERSTSYIQGGVGYGQGSGPLFSAQFTDDNFFGSGDRLNLNFQKSRSYQGYALNFTDPYLTQDGMSITYKLDYSKSNYNDDDLSNWRADSKSFMIDLGYPITEYQNIFFGGGIRRIDITTGHDVAREILQEIKRNGSDYNEYVLDASWNKDTTDDAYMPNSGALNSLYTEITTPGSDSKYYKAIYENRTYFSLTESNSWIFDFHGKALYGDGYGDDAGRLPFYRRFYAGGMSTIRGFKYGSVGPRFSNGDNAGGDFMLSGGIELMTPVSFTNRQGGDIRVGTFLDTGNVWSKADDFKAKDLRYSTGLFLSWRSPIGPLNISYGVPINDKKGDRIERIQFTLGTAF